MLLVATFYIPRLVFPEIASAGAIETARYVGGGVVHPGRDPAGVGHGGQGVPGCQVGRVLDLINLAGASARQSKLESAIGEWPAGLVNKLHRLSRGQLE